MSSKKYKNKRSTKSDTRPLYQVIIVFIILILFSIVPSVIEDILHPNCNRTCRTIYGEFNELKLDENNYKLIQKSTKNSPAVFGQYTDELIEYKVLSSKTARQVYSDVINAFVKIGCKRELMQDYPRPRSIGGPSVMEENVYHISYDAHGEVGACYGVSIKFFISSNNSQNTPNTNAVNGQPTLDISDVQISRFLLSATYI